MHGDQAQAQPRQEAEEQRLAQEEAQMLQAGVSPGDKMPTGPDML